MGLGHFGMGKCLQKDGSPLLVTGDRTTSWARAYGREQRVLVTIFVVVSKVQRFKDNA